MDQILQQKSALQSKRAKLVSEIVSSKSPPHNSEVEKSTPKDSEKKQKNSDNKYTGQG